MNITRRDLLTSTAAVAVVAGSATAAIAANAAVPIDPIVALAAKFEAAAERMATCAAETKRLFDLVPGWQREITRVALCESPAHLGGVKYATWIEQIDEHFDAEIRKVRSLQPFEDVADLELERQQKIAEFQHQRARRNEPEHLAWDAAYEAMEAADKDGDRLAAQLAGTVPRSIDGTLAKTRALLHALDRAGLSHGDPEAPECVLLASVQRDLDRLLEAGGSPS